MDPQHREEELAHELLQRMLEDTFELQRGAKDREIRLHALIEAAGMLKERFEQELAELRQEDD